MSGWTKDLVFALRSVRSRPGLFVAAVLCLSLGIGANTATFSFVNAFLLRPPPAVERPDELVRLYTSYESGLQWGSLSYQDYIDVRDGADVFSGVVAEQFLPVSLVTDEGAERLFGTLASRNYFAVLEVEPVLGRGFLTDAQAPFGGDEGVVLGHALWQRRFGGRRDVLGEPIGINGEQLTVVGVAPPGFQGTTTAIATDLWVSVELRDRLGGGLFGSLDRRGNRSLQPVARLAPGVTVGQAQAAMDTLLESLRSEYPDSYEGTRFTVLPGQEGALHPMYRGAFAGFLSLLTALVGLVLLVTCANVGGLLLARATGRMREVGIRVALGADRMRLLRQLLSESLLLALVAGAVGLVVARLTVLALLRAYPPPEEFPVLLHVPLDGRVLAFTVLLSLGTVLLFGLLPSLQAVRTDVVSALKEGGAALGGRARARSALVVTQVALSLVLLVAAGLFLRSLERSRLLDPGFDTAGAIVASLDPSLNGYSREEARRLYDDLLERVRALPGVETASLTMFTPFSLGRSQTSLRPEGFEVPPGENPPLFDYNVVDVGYFDAVGMPLVEGRAFRLRDDADAPPVVIVNEALARRYWPDETALGKGFRAGEARYEIVGVARTAKYFSLGEDPVPYVYFPFRQRYRGSMTLHVRTAGAPAALAPLLRREMASLDPELPLYGVRPIEDQLEMAFLPTRLGAGALVVFGAMAALLGATGLYSILAWAVGQRRREIGVRIALGAGSDDVMTLVMRQGLVLVAAGLAVGALLVLLLSRPLGDLLYGVSGLDVGTLGVVALLLLAVAVAACVVPARRATRIDPAGALRAE